MPVGFIGLGHLGTAMARRLMEQNVDLVVWNRTRSKAEALGAPVAEFPSHVASNADVIFLNLFDSAAVREVLVGTDGVLTGGGEGKTIIDTTTNHFEQVLSFYDLCSERGAQYVESPILGSVVPASLGKLTIAVSGEKAAYDIALPYLEQLGANIFHLERPGLATRMKLINNLALGSFMATIAEALVLGEAAGLSRATVLDVLAVGAGNSGVLNAKRTKLLDDDYSTHFSSAAIHKDLHYLQDLARCIGKTALIAAIVKEMFALNVVKGVENEDFSVIYRTLREL